MKNKILDVKILALAALMVAGGANAQEFESAGDAVKNMRLGWNLGNTLDSNSGDVENMWIELWTARKPENYETAWGQPVTKPELFKMFKDAGFNAIRVPITWYPHMGIEVTSKTVNGDTKGVWDMAAWTEDQVDAAWMARVKEVVDYVIAQGMYCIINVHHDTGASTTAWLRADEKKYEDNKARYESLWTQIAEEFKDYGQELLMEGYNEMLDTYSSWCFASFACSGNYNASVAESAYNGINSYAQSFVDAVRATGGNNATRNLIVSTYGACNGAGTWNSHLFDPLVNLQLPADNVEHHLIAEVHGYYDATNINNAIGDIDQSLKAVKDKLQSKGVPVIFGEWGVSCDAGSKHDENVQKFTDHFIKEIKAADMAAFYWMTLSDGADRSVPKWSDTLRKDAIEKAYYGEGGYNSLEGIAIDREDDADAPVYNLQGIKVSGDLRPGIYIKGGKKIVIY